jgi:hypothetical protein
MISVVQKANIIALIYLLFIVKYVQSRAKTALLSELVIILTLTLSLQYALFVFNFTENVSPAQLPSKLGGYPRNKDDPNDLTIKYAVPFFFKYKVFRDLKLSYLLGIGVENDQVQNIILDFITIFLVSMYIMHFRNPLLVKSVEKIFW